ncbi:peptidoglycan endopeptidase [Sphingomonas sp.]|uniref:peptidoglycan endopeptidase n=1 Tax=Sphingomonas sp. TaxID=28214 RepID=UPI0035C79A6E
MSAAGERVAAAARALVGVRFRAQGRDPALGLDCVGVALAALRAGGVRVAVRADYALRSARWDARDEPAGLVRCDGGEPGDVLLLRVDATQLHVAVRTLSGIVHADAGLRRVVERVGVVEWPVVAAWRVAAGHQAEG